jgi:hypothetical protein
VGDVTVTGSPMDKFWSGVFESHRQSLDRGEHDPQCEWRPTGFFLCNCSKRSRERRGLTKPPGPLIYQMPICPTCYEEVEHDGDSYTCPRCCVAWDERGEVATFQDDYGDVAAELAAHDARIAEQGGKS